MSDQKEDQTPNPQSQSIDIPIKKRDVTETTLSFCDEILFGTMAKNMKLILFQRKAYFCVLQAFFAESPAISSPRIMIMKDLMKEFNITHKTHTQFENSIKPNRNVQQSGNAFLQSQMPMKPLTIGKKVTEKPLTIGKKVTDKPLKTQLKPKDDIKLKINDSLVLPATIQHGKVIAPDKIQDKEAEPSFTSDYSPDPSFGQVIGPDKIQDKEAKPSSTSEPSFGQVIGPDKIQDKEATPSSTSEPSFGQVIAPDAIQEKVAEPSSTSVPSSGQVIAPDKIQEKVAAEPSATSDYSPVPSSDKFSPESIIGRWVDIRISGKTDYVSFQIKTYDAQTETHNLVSSYSIQGLDDPCNWLDLRHVPGEDIVWKGGHPGIPVYRYHLKPGQTLLFNTTTAIQKKNVTEVGKSSDGIPIIKRIDKGKSIVHG